MKIASLSDRLIGFIIDYLLWILITLFGYALHSYIENGGVTYLIIFLPFLLKDITGQSPGKKYCKTKIMKSNNPNQKPNVLILILRTFFIFMLIFDIIPLFLNNKKRRLADLILGTIVVKV